MNKKVKFRKIPLQFLIETLIMIHESGAEFIDVEGVQDIEQDVLKISVKEEYMSDGNIPPEDIDLIDDKFDDEDLNNLII